MEDFECLTASDNTLTTYKYKLVRSPVFNTTHYFTAAGRGILLRNIDKDDSLSIAYGIIRKPDHEPVLTDTARDVIALCQQSERFSLLLYSALDQSRQTLQAYY